MKLNLHIERLVLEGLPVTRHDGPRIKAAVTAELHRLIAVQGISEALRQGAAVPALRAAEMSIGESGSPGRLGTQDCEVGSRKSGEKRMSPHRTASIPKPFPATLEGTNGAILQKRAASGPGMSPGSTQSQETPTVTALLQRAASETSHSLDEPVRSSLGQHLGYDLSQVRVHSGSASANAAESIGARAYTLGNDIHLGAETRGMDRNEYHGLLTHEAVHTIQQGGRTVAPHAGLKTSSPSDAAEREAEHIAASAASPSLALRDRLRAEVPAQTVTRSVSPHLQRDLTGKKTVKDGDFDLNLKKESHPGGKSGLAGQ